MAYTPPSTELAFYKLLNPVLTEKVKEILLDTSPHKIVQGVRQSGKSLIIKNKSLFLALVSPYSTICIACINHQYNEYFRGAILDLYNNLPSFIKNSIKIRVNCRDRLEFTNGSRITFHSISSPDSFRGMSVNHLFVDEFAFAKNNDAKEFVDNVLYRIICGGTLTVCSTRASRSKKKNAFWRMWLEAIDGKSKLKPFTVSSKDCKAFRSRKDLKILKNNLGRKIYEYEHTLRKR